MIVLIEINIYYAIIPEVFEYSGINIFSIIKLSNIILSNFSLGFDDIYIIPP